MYTYKYIKLQINKSSPEIQKAAKDKRSITTSLMIIIKLTKKK